MGFDHPDVEYRQDLISEAEYHRLLDEEADRDELLRRLRERERFCHDDAIARLLATALTWRRP
jgi:hypothetical protein